MKCATRLVTVAHSWERQPDGNWLAFVFRYCADCDDTHREQLVRVNMDYAYCPVCLCQTVTLERLDDSWVQVNCRLCGSVSKIELEEPDEEFDDPDFVGGCGEDPEPYEPWRGS